MKNEKKKEISSKMYSHNRCGKCNRFGHHHDACQKGLEAKLDKFRTDNKGAGKQTKYLSKPSYETAAMREKAIRVSEARKSPNWAVEKPF